VEPSLENTVTRSWYALTVKLRHEKAVAQALAHKRLEQFLPVYRARRRWSDRVKLIEVPLFHGYVFCRFSLDDKLLVLATPGVHSLVSIGRRPELVSDQEIDNLRVIAASSVPVASRPYLREGQRVVVRMGALEGLEGRLVYSAGACEVVVSVDLLARSVAVRIDRDALELAEEPAGRRAAGPLAVAVGGLRT